MVKPSKECLPTLQIIFALIPPAGVAGGWPCFFVSLGMIGVLTAIVGDLAGIFGCLVGLKDSVTGKLSGYLFFFSLTFAKIFTFSIIFLY